MVPDIDKIIAKYLQNKASKLEIKVLEDWLQQSSDNQELFDELLLIWKEPSREPVLINSEEVKEKVWSRVSDIHPINRKATKTRFFGIPYYLRIAVAAAFLVSLTFSLYYFLQQEGQDGPMVRTVVTKSNPAGQKSRINLPDGSIVWLNAASEIQYDENFTNITRDITLQGEAYFEVVKDSLRPFTVNTQNLSLVVLGTSFNVNAFENEELTHVALIEGKLKVAHLDDISSGVIVLEKGEGIAFNRHTAAISKMQLSAADRFTNMSWRDGVLDFNEDDFNGFIKKIERWYDVKVEVSGEPSHSWRIKASFKNEYLSNVLKSIAFNKDFSYELEGKKLKFIFN